MTSHDLIFNRWGLGQRHPTGLALAFNFAGPSGTGKTICAEAIAHTLGRRLLVVRYAELESMWMGETPKNVAAVFRLARQEQAVLFFDEADAIASRRSTSVDHGFQRESNTVVNVLLQELERSTGSSSSPRISPRTSTRRSSAASARTCCSRCRAWTSASRSGACRCTRPSRRSPMMSTSDTLAETYEVSGGDIRNAVLKAALAAATAPQHDTLKLIHHHHLEEGIRDVVAAKRVMQQSLFDGPAKQSSSQPLMGQMPLTSSPAAVYSLALAGAALIMALVALLVALLR